MLGEEQHFHAEAFSGVNSSINVPVEVLQTWLDLPGT